MSNNLIQFTLFPNLPKELRLKVWEQTIVQSPRIVEICQRLYVEVSEPAQIDPEDIEPKDADPKITESKTVESESEVVSSEEPGAVNDSDEDSSADGSKEDSDDDDDGESKNHCSFYSPTTLPPLLHTSQEARAIALENYVLSFPNGDKHPARIYYNPSIDTLYFPAWCFQNNIRSFELAVPSLVKSIIRRIAIENLIWFSAWNDGSINCHIQIDEFPALDEFLLISRNPDHTGCGCCHEFKGPEEGEVEFVEQEMNHYHENAKRNMKAEFERIKERDKRWNAPRVVVFRKLKRDGEFI